MFAKMNVWNENWTIIFSKTDSAFRLLVNKRNGTYYYNSHLTLLPNILLLRSILLENRNQLVKLTQNKDNIDPRLFLGWRGVFLGIPQIYLQHRLHTITIINFC